MKEKFLVVDDDPIVLESCKIILEAEGFVVTLVSSVDQALKQLTENQFDLLLLDIKMPGQDGIHLMTQVSDRWPDIPLIVMTGYAVRETLDQSYSHGAAASIAKPFTPDELIRAISKVLNKD